VCPTAATATRRRLVGTGTLPVTRARTELIAQYLEAHPEVRDALISGGDGFFISDDLLEYVLTRLRSIKSLEIIRFGTRVADLFAPACDRPARQYAQAISPDLGEYPR